MSSSLDLVSISDPDRTKHPFLVAHPDGYWHCAACGFPASNYRHQRKSDGVDSVIIDDREVSTKWIEVPLSLARRYSHDGDQLAEAVRTQLRPPRAAA